jgi:tripartite-type tricarboxylate transporter receptor subunit TctC
MFTRRAAVVPGLIVLGLAVVWLCPAGACAQGFPSRPVRIIVPFAAGGAVDDLARIIGAKLGASFRQPVVVENHAGAGGNLGADVVAKSSPDGTTILQTTNGQAISPSLYRALPFDAVTDFVPVTQLVASTLVLVAGPGLPPISAFLHQRIQGGVGCLAFSIPSERKGQQGNQDDEKRCGFMCSFYFHSGG